MPNRGLLLIVWLSAGFVAQGLEAHGGETAPAEVFNQRILPIFNSPKPSSCIQCHLAGVDLKNYILPSHEKTFLSLRDQGLIDLKSPEKSEILKLIRMGEKDRHKADRLIHEKTRRAEYEAFSHWIKSCCADEELRSLPPLKREDLAGPPRPDAVIRHARKSRIVDSFARNVWSQRMRCFPCHTPSDVDPDNARHQAAVKTRKKMKEDYGDEVFERLNFFKESPEETLAALIEASQKTTEDQLPILNLKAPEKSLLVLKPMSKLPPKIGEGKFAAPSSVEPVSHMGGLKLHKDDQTYKSFLAWLTDYARISRDGYASVEDLPADNWQPSQLVLRLLAVPDDWPEGTPVQLFLHPWDEERKDWQAEAAAFTQGTVTPRRIVNGALFVLRNPKKKEAAADSPSKLPLGRFLVKVYVDSRGRLEKSPALLLGKEDFKGRVILDAPRWREGFRQAKTVSAERLEVEQ